MSQDRPRGDNEGRGVGLAEFQNEVENHRNKKIKFLRSDRGGEYLSCEFGKHLKDCGIVSQLTPPKTRKTR